MNKPLVHQGGVFLAVGGLQLLLEWSVFVALGALGVHAVPANLCGRVAGALLGFWLNGRYTFAGEDARTGWRHFARFLAVWLPATALSTALMAQLQAWLGLHLSWLAKPVVEGGLAVLSFFVSRHFVYR
ncbi:MAG: GtrA family protein [Pseudoxanthomonas sp.]